MQPIEESASTNQRSCPTSVDSIYPATSLRVHMKVSLAKEKLSDSASNMEPTSGPVKTPVPSKGRYMSFHGNLGESSC